MFFMLIVFASFLYRNTFAASHNSQSICSFLLVYMGRINFGCGLRNLGHVFYAMGEGVTRFDATSDFSTTTHVKIMFSNAYERHHVPAAIVVISECDISRSNFNNAPRWNCGRLTLILPLHSRSVFFS